MTTEDAKTTLEKQRDYVLQDRIRQMQSYVSQRQGGGSGLFDPELTVKTMRSVRYRSEAHAGADITDNSIESGATQVHVLTNTNKDGKITDIAFIDDGSGILPDFLPWAVSWGASSQHGDTGKRNVFGRFGFGLPTASINRGTAYDVISRTSPGPFSMVTVDTKDLPRGADGLPTQPTVVPGQLPVWVVNYVTTSNSPFRGGVEAVRTVVIWRDLDRLTSRTVAAFEQLFLDHFGVTYAGWIGQVGIFVNGKTVQPIDVLFTTPGMRYYQLDDQDTTRAEDHGTVRIPMKAPDGTEHIITVRMSRVGFDAWNAELETGKRGKNPRPRFNIAKDYNGIFVTRHGRFIELWNPVRENVISWPNYMRQTRIHLDFPPELDEVFGITPDKQTISPRAEVTDVLMNKDIFKSAMALQNVTKKENEQRKKESEGHIDDEGTLVSEAVMQRFDEIVTPTPKSASEAEEQREKARKNLERKIKERAAAANVDEDLIRDQVIAETEEKRFKVELVSLGTNGVLYQPEQRGLQYVLQLNVDHPFFTEVYSKIKADQYEVRAGIELLLFTLAYCENNSQGDRAAFYLQERIRWSQHLITQMHVQTEVISKSKLISFADNDQD